jgi:hypothetical protein
MGDLRSPNSKNPITHHPSQHQGSRRKLNHPTRVPLLITRQQLRRQKDLSIRIFAIPISLQSRVAAAIRHVYRQAQVQMDLPRDDVIGRLVDGRAREAEDVVGRDLELL